MESWFGFQAIALAAKVTGVYDAWCDGSKHKNVNTRDLRIQIVWIHLSSFVTQLFFLLLLSWWTAYRIRTCFGTFFKLSCQWCIVDTKWFHAFFQFFFLKTRLMIAGLWTNRIILFDSMVQLLREMYFRSLSSLAPNINFNQISFVSRLSSISLPLSNILCRDTPQNLDRISSWHT